MLFTSLEFGIFLPVVFGIYWWIRGSGVRAQNGFLVLASYVFYGWWDWRFVTLIFLSSTIDFVVARKIAHTRNKGTAKKFLVITLLSNLGLLALFKYYNFFAEEFNAAFTFFGVSAGVPELNLILPVGISFYTFQTLSYSLDVYRGRIQPCQSFVTFLGYVSFFPQLVAGPIERAANLLPQFEKEREFKRSMAEDGLRQMLWGLFKKVAVADACAPHVNNAFEMAGTHGAVFLIIGAILFSFQIYGDFSGYSDIAIGTAKLFGFQLRKNFATPYFSVNISEFWRRWHISLTSWFKDYVYIPLGGNRVSIIYGVRNVIIIFLISGIWHGANWTFIIWGVAHALLFIPLFLTSRTQGGQKEHKMSPISASIRCLMTFAAVTLLWIFFRAESLGQAVEYFSGIFQLRPDTGTFYLPKVPFITAAIMLGFEWVHRGNDHGLSLAHNKTAKWQRWCIYYFLLIIILMANSPENDFIYFQF